MGECVPETSATRARQIRHVAFGLVAMLVMLRPLVAREMPFADIYFETIGDRDSIPSGSITALAQDSHGVFWIGTLAGLIRYDGYRFRRFTHDAADPGSLNGDNIRAIETDADGSLWVACEDQGIAHFDPASGRFTRFTHGDSDPGSLAGDAVLALAHDARGGLWVGTVANGLEYLAPGASAFRHFPVADAADALHVRIVRRLLVDRRGDLWIGGVGGLDRLRAGAKVFEHVATDPADADRLTGHYVYTLFQAHDGRIWIGLQDDGAAVIDPQSLALKRLRAAPADAAALSHPWVDAIAEPRDGEIWLASFGGGIDIVDAQSGRVQRRVRQNLSVAGSLAVDRVTRLFVDESGLLWVGTWGGGLQRHNRTAAFQTLRFDPARHDGLSHPTVLSALEMSDGRIWLGTGGAGIDVLDRERGIVEHFRPDAQRAGALRDGIVLGLARTRDEAIWVGTQQSGLYRYNADGTFAHVDAVASRFRHMLAGRDGTLFVGTENGVYAFDPASGKAEVLAGNDGKPLNLAIWALAESRDGDLWVGTPFGLLRRMHGETFLQRIESPGALSQQGVLDLLVDHSDRLWVATSGGVERLLRVDRGRGEFARVANLSASVARLLVDDQDRLWSERYLIDPRHDSVYEFGRADGVDIGNPPEISQAAATADGTLLFGGTFGLLIVDPAHFAPWLFAPELVASDIRIDGNPRTLDANGLRIEPGEKQLSIEFAALDYSAPERNRYRYRLRGYDERWIESDAAHRVANFTSLAPGAYTLDVQGSNRSGAFSPHALSIPIAVVPAFWQTAWFRAAGIVVLLGITWPVYRVRLALFRARQRELEDTVAARTRDIREAHTQLAGAYARIEELSRTDALTGIGNRRSIDLRVPDLLARVEREAHPHAPNRRLAFFLLDVDRFKTINDEHGHAVGDAVLRALGGLLLQQVREDQLAVRWGGEEFLMVSCVENDAAALAWAERLRRDVAALRIDLARDTPLGFTASIGFACHPFEPAAESQIEWQRVIDIADLALYAAKRAGRNRVVGARPAHALPVDFAARLRDAPATLIADGTLKIVCDHGSGT